MTRRLGIVFFIIFVLAIFNYLGTQFSEAFSLRGSLAPGRAAPMPNPNVDISASRGLSTVSFDLFTKGGKGWDAITQGYGTTAYAAWYVERWHNGVDIAARYGAPLYSPRNGVVIAVGNQDNYCPERGFGKFIAVSDPDDDMVLWYAHLGRIDVSPNQAVTKGTEIGTIGVTGFETGTHLHFSVFKTAGFSMKSKNGCGPDADGQDVNPIPYLEKFSE